MNLYETTSFLETSIWLASHLHKGIPQIEITFDIDAGMRPLQSQGEIHGRRKEWKGPYPCIPIHHCHIQAPIVNVI